MSDEYHDGLIDTIKEHEATISELRTENERLRAALDVSANQLEGIAMAVQKYKQNINVEFFIDYYNKCADKAREVLNPKPEEKE